MEIRNPNYADEVRRIFAQAGFMTYLGVQLADVGAGWAETMLTIEDRHLQHDGYIHAGVQATMADHTSGAARFTVLAQGEYVLTVEYKMNFLRAAKGEQLRCRAEILKPGKTITVVEGSVFALKGDQSILVSKGMFTLAVLQRRQVAH